jgi:hypothetical protein
MHDRWGDVILFLGSFFAVAQAFQHCEDTCKATDICRDGVCSAASCDTDTRWYLTENTGLITDGPGNYSAHMKCTCG